MLLIIVGINNGLTLLGPFSNNFCSSFSIVANPPIPEPTITPNLSLLILSKSNLLLSTACCAAAIAN